jgi:hypothetical protein
MDERNRQWRNNISGGGTGNGSDCRRYLIWGELSLLFSFFTRTFYTMVWVPYKTILFVYLQREWGDGHKKMKKKRNKGYWKQREQGEWVSIWHMRRAKSVDLVGTVVLHILHAGIFLLDADMKLVLPFLFACRYSVYVSPDSVCSPSGYLSSHQYILLNLSLFSYL